jgi:hypothetical protein
MRSQYGLSVTLTGRAEAITVLCINLLPFRESHGDLSVTLDTFKVKSCVATIGLHLHICPLLPAISLSHVCSVILTLWVV